MAEVITILWAALLPSRRSKNEGLASGARAAEMGWSTRAGRDRARAACKKDSNDSSRDIMLALSKLKPFTLVPFASQQGLLAHRLNERTGSLLAQTASCIGDHFFRPDLNAALMGWQWARSVMKTKR